MKNKKLFLLVFVMILTGTLFAGQAEAQKKKQKSAPPEDVTVPATPEGIKPYQGEITQEMLQKFIRVDAQLRQLRQQVSVQTQRILDQSELKPEVYIAIVQKIREDASFIDKLRETAAEMAASEVSPKE